VTKSYAVFVAPCAFIEAAQVVDHFFFTFALTADDTTLRAWLTSRRGPG